MNINEDLNRKDESAMSTYERLQYYSDEMNKANIEVDIQLWLDKFNNLEEEVRIGKNLLKHLKLRNQNQVLPERGKY